MFEREDWTKFRELTGLAQRAGVPIDQIPALVAKELVDNALDANPGGQVYLHVLHSSRPGRLLDGFSVVDLGGGIPGDDDRIAYMFSVNRPLASSKLLRMPSRGALGNGLRVVAGSVLASGGSLLVSTRGRSLRLSPRADTGRTDVERAGEYHEPGTRIDVRLGPSLEMTPSSMSWSRVARHLARGGKPYKGKTSAYWYDSVAFHELLQAAVSQSVVEFVGEFDGCAHPKKGEIAREFAGRLATSLDRGEADRLLEAARRSSRPVPPARLGDVGTMLDYPPVCHARATGTFAIKAAWGRFDAEVPFSVVASSEIAEEAAVQIFVNRTPITAAVGTRYGHKQKSIAIIGSGLNHWFSVGKRPIRLAINIDTPFMPITSDGKAPDLKPFLAEIGSAVEKSARKAKDFSLARKVVAGGPLTQKDAMLRCLDEAIDKASAGGTYRFSIRQLYYAVRPHVIEALQHEPSYDYFCDVITDYETQQGRDIPGIYRDSRGTLYHPHSREVIPLGSLNVERYRRPEWTFNKILYSEKEGFFEVLRDVNWPERHDCALMTSKGFASRAARDVVDLLGSSGEDLTFFCIHDADAYETTIYQALQEETRARPARKVQVINLGLDPDETLAMGLQVEQVKRKGTKSAAVASYVAPETAEWLQSNRVELNAMTTPQFLEWLDRKFAAYAGKVVPPAAVLADRLAEEVRASLTDAITDRVIREARVDDQVDEAMADRRGQIDDALATIEDDVHKTLVRTPAGNWGHSVARIASKISEESPKLEAATNSPGLLF